MVKQTHVGQIIIYIEAKCGACNGTARVIN